MRIAPALQAILDVIGIDASTLPAQMDEKHGMVLLHETHGVELAKLLSAPKGGLAYFNVGTLLDVLVCEFYTFNEDKSLHVDFRTWHCGGDLIQHYVEIEQSGETGPMFTADMIAAIRAAPGPDLDRMPDRNGEKLSSVAILPSFVGDLVIATVQDTGFVRIDAYDDIPAHEFPYIRCMIDVAPAEIGQTLAPLTLAA